MTNETQKVALPVVKLDAVGTAKEIRKILARIYPTTIYPGLKFKVTCKHGSIRIQWFDGPSRDDVRKTTQVFEGAKLVQNGGDMIKGHNEPVIFNGVQYEFGTEWISWDRDFTVASYTILVKYVSDMYGYPMPEVFGDSDGKAWAKVGPEFEHWLTKIEKTIDALDIPTLIWAHHDSASRIAEAPRMVEEHKESEKKQMDVQILRHQIEEEFGDLPYMVSEKHRELDIYLIDNTRWVDEEEANRTGIRRPIRGHWHVTNLQEWEVLREKLQKTTDLVGAYKIYRDDNDIEWMGKMLHILAFRGISSADADMMIENGLYDE